MSVLLTALVLGLGLVLLTALVLMAAASEPDPGSVRQYDASLSMHAI